MIRSFLYLDSEKLRSISSQLFEGVTEQVLLINSEDSTESETQKGPLTSGKVLADIFSKERSSSELKFLEDHAFTLFEKELITREMVNIVDKELNNPDDSRAFFKITAKLRFNDLAATSRLLKGFNDIGEAFWRVTNTPSKNIEGAKHISDNEVKKRASDAGMQLNKKFTDAAGQIVDFGYSGLLEASMIVGSDLFSAPLKRPFLRDDENTILHKYSRVTQRDFTLLGMITQKGGSGEAADKIPEITAAGGLKEAMRSLALHLRSLEQEFSGPSHNETVIDPIAIYATV